jgi:HTH-type transcriptional regulator/antitoxin HigA
MTEAALRTYESLAEFAPIGLHSWRVDQRLLEERGWTQADLATRTGFTTKHVNLLLKGKAPISEETALRLERVLGSTARFWLNLEAQYREHVARQESVKSLAKHIDWLKELPLSEMVKFGWLRRQRQGPAGLRMLRYFGVADVDAWREQYERPVAAYRASAKLIRTPAAVSAWLRCGERAAEDMRLGDFDGMSSSLPPEDRTLTAERDPKLFIPRLTEECARVGVAVVLAPAPKGCPVSGATKWLGTNKALIMLSFGARRTTSCGFLFS